jgi:hypothetical protein
MQLRSTVMVNCECFKGDGSRRAPARPKSQGQLVLLRSGRS